MAKILIIEDNAANLDLMIYILAAFGHTTCAARSGEEGLELAATQTPDLIVCDIQLPKIDGYEVLKQLKHDAVLREIPVIAVTAMAMVGDRDSVLAAGFDGYLAKPIDPELFARQIDPWLSAPSSMRAVPGAGAVANDPPPSAHATVLAVDNVPDNLQLVRSVLEPFGYRVITSSGPGMALEQARRERPDLILSDICMDDGSGFDFIRTVKTDPRLASVPFVFITSSLVEQENRAKGLALGADRFLLRPIDPEQLLSEVKACLAEGKSDG